MTGRQPAAVDAPRGEASEPVGGQARSLAEVSAEELLALPPFPIRHPDFINGSLSPSTSSRPSSWRPVSLPRPLSHRAANRMCRSTPSRRSRPSREIHPRTGRQGTPRRACAPTRSRELRGHPADRVPASRLHAGGRTERRDGGRQRRPGRLQQGRGQTFRWANFTAMFSPVLPAGAQMFDPKLAFDHYADRWIVCIAARRANPAARGS